MRACVCVCVRACVCVYVFVYSFIFESIILILAGKGDMHESLDEIKFRPDTTTSSRARVIGPCASEKFMYNVMNTLAPPFFYRIFFILAGYENIYNLSDEFEIRPDRTKD